MNSFPWKCLSTDKRQQLYIFEGPRPRLAQKETVNSCWQDLLLVLKEGDKDNGLRSCRSVSSAVPSRSQNVRAAKKNNLRAFYVPRLITHAGTRIQRTRKCPGIPQAFQR